MKFLADAMLARLGRWLRMMGYDTIIMKPDVSDEFVVRKAVEEDRVILTRDKRIRASVKVLLVKSDDHLKQLKEVFDAFHLKSLFPEHSRCSVCNGELRKIGDKWVCIKCGKLYWEGSHWIRIKKSLKELGY